MMHQSKLDDISHGCIINPKKISRGLYGEYQQKIRKLGGFSYIYLRRHMYILLVLTRYLYIREAKKIFYLLYCVVCPHVYIYVSSPNRLISGTEISNQYGENAIFLKT